MPDALQTTPFASSSIHDDFEVPPSVPEKKPLLPIVSSWLVSLVRRKPFLSSAIISAILIGSVAGVVQWSYYRDIQSVYQVIPPGSSGVSGVTSRSWIFTETMCRRSHSSGIVIS